MGPIRAYIDHHFLPHPTQQVRELLESRVILDFAVGAVSLFVPIYLYTIGYSFAEIALFFAIIYAMEFLVAPLGGRLCRRHGYEHMILLSSPFLIIWYLSLFAIPFHPSFMVVAVVALVIQKTLYWPSYHADFIEGSLDKEEGREVSTVAALGGVAAAVAPAVGGLTVAVFGFKTLFIAVSALILLSNIPLLKTPEMYIPRSFDFGGAFRRFAEAGRRQRVFGFAGLGEQVLNMVAWPLFLVAVIPDFRVLGAVVSGAMLINVLVTMYIGRLADNGNREPVLRAGITYVALSWIVRPFIAGGFGVFMVDTFYRTSWNMVAVPMLARFYHFSREGDPVEESVFLVMAISIGRAAALAVVALIFWRFSEPWVAVFLAGFAFSLLYTFLAPIKLSQ